MEDTELDNGEPERGPRRAEQRSDEGRVPEALQDVQSITPAGTGAPADAAAVSNTADNEAGQDWQPDRTRDGNMAVPGKVGGNGTNPRGELRGALRSAADRISSSISRLTGGLTAAPRPARPAPAAPRLANPAPAAPRPANPAPAAPIAATPAPAAGTGPSKERYRLGCAAVRCGHCGGGFRRHRGSDPVAGGSPVHSRELPTWVMRRSTSDSPPRCTALHQKLAVAPTTAEARLTTHEHRASRSSRRAREPVPHAGQQGARQSPTTPVLRRHHGRRDHLNDRLRSR